MKKLFYSALAFSLLITQTGCFGSFELTKRVWEINDGISNNKFVKTLVFYAANIVPVYGIAGFVDVAVLNLIEFWSGSNPLALNNDQMEEQLLTYKGDTYKLVATKNKMSVHKLEGDMMSHLGELEFEEKNETWSFHKNNHSTVLIEYAENQNVNFFTELGMETLHESSLHCQSFNNETTDPNLAAN